MAVFIVIGIALLALSGCTSKIDGTSERSFQKSLIDIRETLSEEKREQFEAAIKIVTASRSASPFAIFGIGLREGVDPESMRHLHGMTADAVIAKAREIAEANRILALKIKNEQKEMEQRREKDQEEKEQRDREQAAQAEEAEKRLLELAMVKLEQAVWKDDRGCLHKLSPFTLNLGNPLRSEYAKLTVAIDHKCNDEVKAELQRKLPLLRDAIINTVTRKTGAALKSPSGKAALSNELFGSLNKLMDGKFESVVVEDLAVEP